MSAAPPAPAIDPEASFAQALAPRAFSFPDDHAPHPGYRTEWWYFTGNLEGEAGRRFGYELTLFRIGLTPRRPSSPSAWRQADVWMGHLAVTDVDAGRFRFQERLSRPALGLAGAREQPLTLWLED